MSNRTEKRRAYMAEYYRKNKERMDEQSSKWQKAHPDCNREYSRRYVAKNPEKEYTRIRLSALIHQDSRRKQARKRYHENPEHHREINRKSKKRNPETVLKQYAKRRSHGPLYIPKGTVRELETLQLGTCIFCPADILNKRHIDHILPLARGGLHVRENLQILCPRCNCSKGAKTNEEFAEWLEANQ